jgi:FAD/FMN-containing dehydrogenase/Fe-S oxidoreductase
MSIQHSEAESEIAHELTRTVRGEVRFDSMSRWLYSTDASSYQVLPAGVVIPRDADDISAIVQVVAQQGASIVPRGGGTSLSGQTIGPGIILDLSRHIDGLLELNAEAKWVRVQAGMNLDKLNNLLRPHNLMVGPDPASSMAATLGGMTGNNSTGSHSIQYGMMADHVTEVDVVLSDGSQVRFSPRTPDEVAALVKSDSLEGHLCRDIPALIGEYSGDIASRYPKTWRNVAGYNLHRMAAILERGESLNLAPLIVGSEGTLGVITTVKLKLVGRPKITRLALLHFDDLRAALALVPFILEHKPSAVELVDRYFNHLTRQSPEYGPRLTFIEGDPRAALIVEFAGSDESEVRSRAETLESALRREGFHGVIVRQTTPEQVANVWGVRKAGLGLLMNMRGDAKPLAFVDDATVPVNNLADYALEVERLCSEAGTSAAFYAHASAGCLHINPLINLKTGEGLRQMRRISEAVAELAISYGGTTTGEHGEGLARSYYNEKLYGARLHQAFRQVKALFDPDNRLNPGKIIDAPAPWEPDILRFNPNYATLHAPQITHLDFSADGGFGGLVEMCNGQGVCRKRDNGVMCPSFMATRDEAHSTRGRANALRAAMTGQLGREGLASKELYDVLDLCLECKACKRECPSLVDMAKLKYEFLAHYQAVHSVPLRSRMFARIHDLNRLGSLVPALTNWSFHNRIIRYALDRWLGIDRRRTLPAVATQTFQRWFRGRSKTTSGQRGMVILWDDTFLSYNEPEIGQAAVRVLEAAGFEIRLIENRRCCGRPMISKGLLADAKDNAAYNVELLAPFAVEGVPIIGLEPSCIATFRDEYPDLLRTEEARLVAKQSFFIEEFLTTLPDLKLPFLATEQEQKILVHGHCYQKALIGTGALVKLLRMLPNTTVTEIASGCCGMAGSFGYEKEHYELSMTCAEDRLFPAVRDLDSASQLVASGMSCRHQIADGTGRTALHPIVLLARYLAS